MRRLEFESLDLRRSFRKQAELNAASQREIPFHALLGQYIAVKLRIFERQRHMHGK